MIAAITATSFALAENIDKLSAGTQMFLMMRAENAKQGNLNALPSNNSQRFRLRPEIERGVKSGFAPTEIIDNVEMIDAFIYLQNPNIVSSLESKGVIVMTIFDKFVTAKVPIDKIEEIGNLSDVIQIDVSRLLQPKTDIASSITNASRSWDGVNNGLCDNYTGQGVIVGVVDQGIHFKHTAFNDANGNTRVKRVYAPGRSSSVYNSNFPDYDVTNGSHGTHTSTTAGGRAVTLNGSTYSGMAPECDLFLCGLNSLSSTNIANSLSKIKDYASSTGQPCVVNISLGSQYGAHDGTGSLASAYSSFTNNGTAKGRIICLAAGNDGEGNIYFGGTATSSTPAVTGLEYNIYSDVEGTITYRYSSSYYSEYYVWPRTAGANLKFKFVIIDKKNKSVVWTSSEISTGSVSLSSTYFSNGAVNISRSSDSYSGKNCYDITVRGTSTESTDNMSTTSDGKLFSRYAVGMMVYSGSNSSVQFDCWADGFSGFLDADYAGSYGNYTIVNGSSDCSIGNECSSSGVITVGAYVSKKTVTTSNNISFDSDEYTVGEIAPFSSYSTGCGPDGNVYPDITAPGAILIAGVNKYDTNNYPQTQTETDEYMTIGNTSDGSRFGSMSGTSMATPTTTGIIALWLQANPELTASDIKEIFSHTAIRDSYVTGTNSTRFGKYGKIDALNGLKFIAPCEDVPVITAYPTSLDFGDVTAGGTATQTFTVTGTNLEGNIALSKSGNNYTIDKTSITKNNDGTANATVTVTFSPIANVSQTYNGIVTLTSSNATTVTVSLTGKGIYNAPTITANPTSLSFTGNSGYTYTKTVTVVGSNLQGNITAAILNDANGFYSVSPTSFNAASQTVTVTWSPTAGGTSTANLVLTTTGTGANTVIVPITGTAQGPTIAANPTSVTFSGYVTQTYTQTVTVTGTNLSQNITASLTGADVYSIDKSSLTKTGGTITITYAPTATGNTNATLSLSSSGASTVIVPINGTAQAATPTLIVAPISLTFSSDVNTPESKTFAVTGRFINEDVTINLNDPSGVFTLEQATIPAASISETDAVNVTVTFQSADEGDFAGSVTVASDGATSQTVNLNATISTGGTASDNYLNIAKYATIDEAGATVSGMSTIYKYTEYEDNGCAWLTVSNYGALQADDNQNWLTTSSLSRYSNTWSASDIFLGNNSYFSNNSGYSIYGSGSQIFYVTNCTQVKAFVKGSSNSYYNSNNATLSIYECTKNADGTLEASNTEIESHQGNDGILASSTLNASMYYKIQLTGGGGYPDLLEIGFQTELNNSAIKVDPVEIDYITLPGMPVTKSFTVTGRHISQDVTLTLTDPENHYELSTTTISIAEALAGATVNVTFNAPKRSGSYRAVVNLTSGDIINHVGVYGSVGAEGTAFSEYLDITKYSTIGLNDWYEGYINNPYKYTEYETNNTVWLSLPVIMARYAWFYNDQNWLGLSAGNYMIHKSESEGLNWAATDVFQGDDYYFTSTKSYGLGSVNQNNTDIFYTVYNVTNCTQVKTYGYNGSSVKPSGWYSTSYPAILQIYELTENADGTLTQAENYVDNQTSTTNSSDIVLTSIELDPSKIYRVYVAGYRSYFYEVAFRAPLITTEATLAKIEAEGYPGNRFKIKDELVAVFADADRGLLWCKDQGNASIDPTRKKDGQVDYMRDVTKEQIKEWDQSNWVMLQFPEATEVNSGIQSLLKDAVGKRIAAGSITGRYIDDENYAFEVFPVNNEYTLATGADAGYVKNLYCPANFLESNLNLTEESTGYVYENINTGTSIAYFFMNPKVQEVCEITYAVWDGDKFVLPAQNANGTMNDTGIPGAIAVDWSINQADSNVKPEIGQGYRFVAVVHRTNGSNYGHLKSFDPIDPMGGVDVSKNLMIAPLNFTGADDQIVTEINSVFDDGSCEVMEVKYVNVAGMVSDKPFQGINIVITRFSDGSKTTIKKVFK